MLSKKSKFIYVFVLSIFAIVGFIISSSINTHNTNKPTKYSNQLGGDFSIPTAQGVFNLADHRGKVVVLYFGYASCPDVCPTALALLGNSMKKMPKDTTDQIQPLFISVDPGRDDLAKLETYAHYFFPTMLGATTVKADIDTLVKQYGAFYSFSQLDNSAMGYSVDHSSRLYLINKQGQLADVVSHADIQKNLSTKLLSLTN